MRTNVFCPATASLSLVFLLAPCLIAVDPPRAAAAGWQSPPVSYVAPSYLAYSPPQQTYASRQNVSLTSSAGVTERMDLVSVSPETMGDLMMIHQEYLAAIEAYQRAPQNSAVICNKLGIAYQHMYALDFAKLQYEKALSINPKYAEAMNNLGTVFYGEQNYHKAEKYYLKAIRMQHKNASFYSNLGTAYFADHDFKRGLRAYRKAFQIDPDVFIGNSLARITEEGQPGEQATLNYDLAELYAQAGMTDAAIHYLRLAFIAGFDNHKKLLTDPAFAKLLHTQQFQLLLTEEHLKRPGTAEQSLVVPSAQPPQ